MIKESRPVLVYNYKTNELIGPYESIQRASVRLQLASGNSTYTIVDGINKDLTKKKTWSKTLKVDVYIKTEI